MTNWGESERAPH